MKLFFPLLVLIKLSKLEKFRWEGTKLIRLAAAVESNFQLVPNFLFVLQDVQTFVYGD